MLRNIIILLASTAIAVPLLAQQQPNLQNTVERFDPGKTATEISEPDLTPPATQPRDIVDVKRQPKAHNANDPVVTVKFKLTRIILLGNTVFSETELSKLYADKINTDVSLTDLEAIASKITEYYRIKGYVLSQAIIPPQEIDKGVVSIKIIEGYINKVSITGNVSDHVTKVLNDYGVQITRQAPLKIESLERFAFLANDIPGVNVRAVLAKSEEYTGAADLVFVVTEKKYGGSLAFNNYNQEVLGRQQFIGNIHLNNLTYASQTAINGIISPDTKRMRYISFNHKQQLTSNGLGGRVAISSIDTTPDMGTIGLGGLDIPGKAFITTVGVDYAWIRSHSRNLFVGSGFKLLNSTTEFGQATLFKDNIRSINVFLSYDNLFNPYTTNTYVFTITQGLNIFNAQGNPPSRVGEDLTFTKLELYLSSLHFYKNSKFSSVLAVKGQYAFELLPSSETFTYGGVPIGYGYDPSEFTGDRGVAASFELRYPALIIPKIQLLSHVFGFADIGYVWDLNKNVSPSSQYGASTGAGIRMNMRKHVNCDFIVGVPLKPSTIEGTPNFVRLLLNIKAYF